MRRRWLCGVLALLVAGFAVGCASFSTITPQTVSWLDVFDTVTNVTVYGVDGDTFSAGAEKLHQRLREYHQLFDIYHTYEGINNLKTVNDNAGKAVQVSEPILDLLEYGLRMYDYTDGQVNILFGAVLRPWHDSRETGGPLPDPSVLQAASHHTSPESLVVDRAAGTVCITDPSASLDVGAIAKGYAAELAAEYAATELGFSSLLLDVGGNVRINGDKGGKPFTIGVRNPDTDSARPYLLTIGVSDCAVVTSGDYQRYFELNGQRYAHIIDPDTLYPAAYVRAVTVVCGDSGLADVLSTALFAMSVEEGAQLVESTPDAEAVWVLPDGSLRYSTGFEALIV